MAPLHLGMIEFKCRCSHPFTVEEDQAGASLQCPACGLLVDVPSLSDLPNLLDDGTYTMGEVEEAEERGRVGELYRSFTRETVDPETGEEFDLRMTREEIGGDAVVDPMRVGADPRAVRPKYDPETGELIRPLDVEGDEERRVGSVGKGGSGEVGGGIPMAAAVVVPYASVATEAVPGVWRLGIELLMPVNVAVMFFVSLGYLVGQLTFSVGAGALGFFGTAGLSALVLLNLPIVSLLLAHYGCVVEDTGPEMKDELPRPLRHLGAGDDLLKPMFRMLAAVAICYGPAVAALINGLPWQVAAVVAMVGSLFLPAVMLTTNTSGSLSNWRPDRVLGVIGACGAGYFVSVALWVGALALHLWTWVGVLILAEVVKGGANPNLAVMYHPLVMYPMIAVAIYGMHLFCWHLGTMYRRHHHAFPWVLQRHVPVAGRRVQGPVVGGRIGGRNRVARPR